MTEQPGTLSARETAARLGVHVNYVRLRCNARAWPHLRIGNQYRFTPAQVAEIIRMHTAEAEPDQPKSPTPERIRPISSSRKLPEWTPNHERIP
jgi:hypothetical protein